jgi:chromodomain-helicase-DNA-binding protein 7
VVKCSMGRCGRFYHSGCVQLLQHTKAAGGAGFRCPVHYCASCGLSGDGVVMVQCIRCPKGYHARCRPAGCRTLSKRFIVCPRHGS